MAGRIPKVVVVGPAYVDMAVKCDRFPGPGQTVEGGGFSCVVTGAGPNRAVQAALCGCEAYLVSKVGDDLFGEMAKKNLDAQGVNTDFVYTAQAMSTGVAVTMVDSMGENSGCVSEGANKALSSDEVGCASTEQLIGSADVCLIAGGLGDDVVATAIRMANLYRTKVILQRPITVLDDGSVELPKEFYSVNVLIPDLCESIISAETSTSNTGELKFIGSEIVASGVECVVIRMGQRGSLLVDREGSTHIRGFEVEVVDHTACDDAFGGALAASCGAGDVLKEAVRFAAAAEALARGKFGSQESLPKKNEIIELLQNQPE